MTIDAVILDAFGTVVDISQRTHPYRQVLNEGIRQGRRPTSDDLRILMTNSLSIAQAADRFGIELTPEKLRVCEAALNVELESIKPFPDALDAISMLRGARLKLAICSNLAMPYGSAVRRLFQSLDCYTFSFEMGCMKPDPDIYLATCHALGVRTGQVAMVGDSPRCDKDGALAVGIQGFHLNRAGLSDVTSLIDFASFVIDHNTREIRA